MHRIYRYFSLLEGMSIKACYQRPAFSISDNDHHYVDDFISQNHLHEKPIAIIHPGTSMFGKFKRWPPENYAVLADRLIKEMNYSVVFTWLFFPVPITVAKNRNAPDKTKTLAIFFASAKLTEGIVISQYLLWRPNNPLHSPFLRGLCLFAGIVMHLKVAVKGSLM